MQRSKKLLASAPIPHRDFLPAALELKQSKKIAKVSQASFFRPDPMLRESIIVGCAPEIQQHGPHQPPAPESDPHHDQ